MPDTRARWPQWLITKYDISKMNALTIWLGCDGEALAVFGFEEEAEMFLHLRRAALEEGWRVRQTSAGELVSVLYGPCSNAKKVVLDPLPGVVGGEELIGFLSMRRKDFLRILLGEEPSGLHLVPSQTPRPPVRLEHANVAQSSRAG
jgi:hypothetical protein